MAKVDINDLLGKVENSGATDEGLLTAAEFNRLVRAIIDNQGACKKIVRNNVEYIPDGNGVIRMTILSDSDLPTVQLKTSDSLSSIISTDGTVTLHLRYVSVLSQNGENTDTGHDGTLTIQRRANSSSEWLTVATLPVTPTAFADEDTYQPVNVSEYLMDGEQQLRIKVTDDDVSVDSAWLVFQSVVKTSLSVEFVSQWQNPIEGGEGASAELSFVLFGSVSKELHLKISGENSVGTTVYREIVLANATIQGYTGRANPYTYTLTDLVSEECKILSVHGIHSIEAWLQATADSSIQSEHIFCQILVIADPEDDTKYLILQGVQTAVTNYVATTILQYAVYNPAGGITPLTFTVGNYAGTVDYLRYEVDAQNGIQYQLYNTVEIEDASGDSVTAYLRVTSGDDDMLTDSIGADVKAITVDNSENYSPTTGADFFVNPKTRNNTEANPGRILNAAQNNAQVAAVFSGFGWQNDGWLADSAGQKCLRMKAGQTLDITGYDAFQTFIDQGANYNNQQASMTIELDFAVRNVTDEDTPIIRMCSYMAADGLPLGLELKPMEGVMMTRSQRVAGQQNFAWQEGKRTHMAINCYYNLGAATGDAVKVSYVRVFINGVIEREFLFDHSRANEFWQNDSNGVPSSLGIRIGQSDADIDIYGIKVYKKALSSKDIQQDYKSTLPTSTEKLTFASENNILADGVISYALAAAKYNVLVWYGDNVAGHNEATKADKTGRAYLQLRDASGAIDKAHSGDLTGLSLKGQGSTAKHYYEWNVQYQWKGASGSFVDLNGVDHGQKYQLRNGLPWAKKLVGKINYASSMQSHKAGACDLYDALYKRIVSDWSVQNSEGYENTRVAVPEEPVLFFVQTANDSNPVFQGLMTFGPGKADKPTWGYVSSDFPDMAMMEGSDNNFPLADQRVPWRTEDVTYNPEEEFFEYNGEGNIDFDMGRTSTVTDDSGAEVDVPHSDIVAYYRAAWNWCYKHNCLITFYDGTYEQLVADQNVNTKLAYWVTQSSDGAAQFDLFRVDYQGKDAAGNDILRWVPAGLTKTNGVWDTVNLMEDTPVSNTGLWSSMNAAFQAARTAAWKAGAGNYFSVLSLQFHQSFMKFIAGTDNRSKNTYYVLDPVTHKIHFHADDLDTIMLTNNTGWQSKPYYIEEHDTDANGNTYWEGQYNVLFDLCERAFADTLPQMMKTILSNMAGLVESGTVDKYGTPIEQTPEGCMKKYFFRIQQYFPAVAYNETARIRYETAQLAVANGSFTAPDGINPITQSLGSQEQAERQYMKRRLIYLSSYAAYGEFAAGGTSGSLSIRGMATTEGQSAPMQMLIKPHQWLYPTGAIGNSLVDPHVRLAPGGKLVDAQGHPYGDEGYLFNIGTVSGDTSVKLSGINYMKSIGNLASLSTNPAYSFTVSGERLVEFVAEPAAGQTAQFRPSSIIFTAPNLKTVNLHGCSGIGGEVSLASQTRLQTLDLRGTAQVGVVLPKTETLTSAKLPGRLTELIVQDTPNLAQLTIESYEFFEDLQLLENCGSFSTQRFIEECYAAGASLSRLVVKDIAWDNLAAEIARWLIGINNITLTGTMNIGGTSNSVTFDMKVQMLLKWGAIDDAQNPLYVTYPVRILEQVSILGGESTPEPGDYPFNCKPILSGGAVTAYGNNFKSIRWSISDNLYATINAETGVVTAASVGQETSVGGPEGTITVTVTKLDDTTLTATKTIRLYDRSAHIGDYVFYDGTFSDNYDGSKTPIAICFYILNGPDGKPALRLGMALTDLSTVWGLYDDATNGIKDIVIEEGLYDAYDLPMTNVTSSGVVAIGGQGSANYISDATYRDESEEGEDGFRKFTTGAISTLGLTELPAAFHQFNQGDKVPYGWYFTQQIIDHRDRILSDLGLEIPQASENETENQALTRLIAAIQADGGATKYQQYYYPAASRAHAFEPTTLRSSEHLADKFKAGKWWLPSPGELGRLYWYHSKGYAGADHAIFTDAYTRGLMKSMTYAGTVHWTSQEYSRTYAWYIHFSNGFVTGSYKYNTLVVRPVVAF